MKNLILIVVMIVLLAGCGKSKTENFRIISVSILPQKYFVERITGDKFKVNVLLPPGENPHSFEPKQSILDDLSKSEIYFAVGQMEFEKVWKNRFKTVNPDLKIFDVSDGIDFIVNEEHLHSDIDPHIWMSVSSAKIIAMNIYETLISVDPENKDYYKTGYDQLCNDLEKLNMQIGVILNEITVRKFIIYHPSLAYFARDYRLEQIPIEIDGKEPSQNDIKKIIDTANEYGIKTIFVQKQLAVSPAESIARVIGGKVLQIDPLDENWFGNMAYIARIFQFELKCKHK